MRGPGSWWFSEIQSFSLFSSLGAPHKGTRASAISEQPRREESMLPLAPLGPLRA